MRLLALLVIVAWAGAAWGDASTPATGGQQSPIWPAGLDSILLGVDARGQTAIVSRREYSLPSPSGTVQFTQCWVRVYDADAQLLLSAGQGPVLVRDGRLVHGGWQLEGPGAGWFRATVPPAAGCEDAVAVLRASRRWSVPTPSGPARHDWQLCREGPDVQAVPDGDLSMDDDGECLEVRETARLLKSPRTRALIVGQHHFAVVPPGWRLSRSEAQ